MQRTLLWAVGMMMVAGMASAQAAPAVDQGLMPWESVECAGAPGVPEVWASLPDPTHPGLLVTVHALCYAPGGEAFDACSSEAYSLTGYAWSGKYAAKFDPTDSGLGASGVGSAFGASGSAWDKATSGSIWDGVAQNNGGASAGKLDGVNQFGFRPVGGNTIAVTYTWSSGGVAVESDAKYNTNFAWSLNGEANKMDLQNIATHEVGHSFGLGHPASTDANSCLTMYAYADYGETQKRSLEAGDKAGIKNIYG